VEDRARKRLGMEPLALTDELLERIEELGETAFIDALALLQELPDEQRLAIEGRVLDTSVATRSCPP
jgi:hypothetical protein